VIYYVMLLLQERKNPVKPILAEIYGDIPAKYFLWDDPNA